jgi:hypothetical protein
MSRKEILYPDFLNAMKYACNDFWSHFFEDMAHGNFPYGVYVRDKAILYCNIKNKKFMFQFYGKGGKEIHDTLYDIFFSKFYIHNTLGKLTSIKLHNIPWNKIKKKMIKTILFEQYVIRKRNEYDLSYAQIMKLLSNINLGIYFKLIDKSHIDYDAETCSIVNIEGITFQPKQIYFDNIFRKIPDTPIEASVYEDALIYSQWSKYLSS